MRDTRHHQAAERARPRSRGARGVTGVFAAMVLLSGCAAAEPSEEAIRAETAEPLAELNRLLGDYRLDLAEAAGDITRVAEEAIAGCMADAGFEYVPAGPQEAPDRSDAERVEASAENGAIVMDGDTSGYGIAEGMLAGPPQPGAAEGELSPHDADPNTAIRDALSASEARAYDEALRGELSKSADEEQPGPGDEGWEYDWRRAGCSGAGWQQAEQEQPPEDPALAEIEDALLGLSKEIGEDPGISAVEERWGSCLEDAGFPGFTERNQPRESILRRAEALLLEGGSVDPDASAELIREEIELAEADQQCAEDTDVEGRLREITREHETRFAEEYRQQIDGVIALLGSR